MTTKSYHDKPKRVPCWWYWPTRCYERDIRVKYRSILRESSVHIGDLPWSTWSPSSTGWLASYFQNMPRIPTTRAGGTGREKVSRQWNRKAWPVIATGSPRGGVDNSAVMERLTSRIALREGARDSIERLARRFYFIGCIARWCWTWPLSTVISKQSTKVLFIKWL